MKQYRSDGRYKYHGQGFHYIVDFAWNNRDDQLLFTKLTKVFAELYGDEKTETKIDGWRSRCTWNENWRSERNFKAKRRRIYLKEESVLSLALLRIG